jgi:hypothetical protein
MFKILIFIIFIQNEILAMHNFYTNINTEDIEIKTELDIAQYTNNIELEKFYIGARILYLTDKYSNSKPEAYYEGNFHLNFITNEIPNLKIKLGAKINYTNIKIDNKNNKFVSIPLTIGLKYKIDQFNIPFKLRIEGSISPNILTFNNGINFYELDTGIDINIMKYLDTSIGFRSIYTNYINKNIKLNQSCYFGVKIKF